MLFPHMPVLRCPLPDVAFQQLYILNLRVLAGLVNSCTNAHCWLFLCGIRFRGTVRVSVKVSVRVRVRVRLKVLLTRFTVGVLYAFVVRECLASSHLSKIR